jgi:drug/metabolite transporter (DMT)-like permease
VVSLQPVLTSTLANRWLGERVLPRQWLGLLLGIAGVYLIVQESYYVVIMPINQWLERKISGQYRVMLTASY